MEVWLPVPDFEGIYEVSSLGAVRSIDRLKVVNRKNNAHVRALRGKTLKGIEYVNEKGKVRAVVVGLRNGGKYHFRSIHDLVLTAFVGPRPTGMYGCHIDDVPKNNDLSNLYWGTPTENSADKIRNGNQPRGTGIPWSKVDEDGVSFIRANAGIIPQSEMASMFGVVQAQISRIVNRKQWEHLP